MKTKTEDKLNQLLAFLIVGWEDKFIDHPVYKRLRKELADLKAEENNIEKPSNIFLTNGEYDPRKVPLGSVYGPSPIGKPITSNNHEDEKNSLSKEEMTNIFIKHAVWSEEHGHDIILDITFQKVIAELLGIKKKKDSNNETN